VLCGLAVLEKHAVPSISSSSPAICGTPRRRRPAANLKLADQCSKPRIKHGEIDDWKRELAAAAKVPEPVLQNLRPDYEADWNIWRIADLKPYVDHAIECFGPQRCMFGSDWPVCLLAGSYERWKEADDELFSQYSAAERGMMKGQTAIEFYGLKV
jgi:L-fuconolactonase